MENVEELLRKILEQLSKPQIPSLPIAIDLWDTRMVAAYLKRSVDTIREDVVSLPSFPKPVRLPLASGARSQALYKAREVIAWAERHTAR